MQSDNNDLKAQVDKLYDLNNSGIRIENLEAFDLINTLNLSKSVSPDSIPINLLKILGSCVSPHLPLLANNSFQTVIFLTISKLQKVVALFKRGDHKLPSTCRLISLLSIFNKLFEKRMYKTLYEFLEVNKVLIWLWYFYRFT